MKKKLIALCLTLSFGVVALAGCGGAAQDSSSVAGSAPSSSDNTVVVGTNPTFPPFEFQEENGDMKGFDLDLMRAIGEEEGFEVEFKSLSFDSLVGAVKSGEIDAVAAGMSITPERLEQLAFAGPYMDASLGVYVGNDNKDIKSVEDLKDKVVAAQAGTTGAEEVQKLADEKKISEAKILEDYNMCFMELENGGAEALVIDVPVAQAYMAENKDKIKMVGDPYVADFYGIAISKDNKELLEKVNAGLKKLIENGKFDELCKQYNLPVPAAIKDGTAKVKGVNA